MSSLRPIAALSLALFLGGQAQAAAPTFDGAYDLTYTTIGGTLETCIFVETNGLCAPMDITLTLEDGTIAESTLEALVDDAIDAIEEATGREMSESTEARIEQAIETLYPQIESQLGHGLSQLPHDMTLKSSVRQPSKMLSTLTNQNGRTTTLPGTLSPESGEFAISGILEGQIHAQNHFRGQGLTQFEIDQAVQNQDIWFSVSGTIDAYFNLAQN